MPRRIQPWTLVSMACSGFAGLSYQVVWTRQTMNVASAAATAQAVVLAAFLAGLGFGAWLGGLVAPRARRPFALYALAEAGAAVLAAASPLALDASVRLLPRMTHWFSSPVSASWAQLGLVSVLLLPATTLLGMSLPLMIEQAERNGGDSVGGRRARVGILYAANTLGAACGALFAGFWSIETLGLSATLRMGGCVAVAAALLALVRGRTLRPALSPPPDPPRGVAAGDGAVPGRLSVVVMLAGGAGLGAEVVWTRLFSVLVPTTVYALTLVLAAVLVGVAAGAGLSGLLSRAAEDDRDPLRRVLRQAALLQVGAAVLVSLGAVVLIWRADDPARGYALASGHVLDSVLLLMAVVVVPAALNGATLPLLAGAAPVERRSRACGRLYAANTAGCLVGSLLTGLVLLPHLGTRNALCALTVCDLGAALVLASGVARDARLMVPLCVSAVLCLGTLSVVKLPLGIYEKRVPPHTRILDMVEGVSSDLMVTEDDVESRRLWINSVYVAASGRHRLLGHLPALMVDQPRHVLGIALGTGQTFASAMKHGVERFECVEINPDVITLAKRWFAGYNRGILDDPRVRITIADGRTFLRTTPERYDLVVIEPLQAWSVGTTALYTHEFYGEAKRRLAPGGVLAQWIPFYGQGVAETRAMVLTALEVFPEGSLWLDGEDGILILRSEPLALSPSELFRRVQRRGIQLELAEGDVEREPDLLSLFLAGPGELRSWAGGAERLTDDRPFLEFKAARQLESSSLREILTSMLPRLGEVGHLLPGEADRQPMLVEAHGVREVMLSLLLEDRPAARVDVLEEGLRRWPGSQRIATAYRNEIESWAKRLAVRPGGSEAARQVLMRGLEHLPNFGEAALDLAALYANNHQLDEAIEIARVATGIERTKAQTAELLGRLLEIQRHGTGRARPAAGPGRL